MRHAKTTARTSTLKKNLIVSPMFMTIMKCSKTLLILYILFHFGLAADPLLATPLPQSLISLLPPQPLYYQKHLTCIQRNLTVKEGKGLHHLLHQH